MKKCEQGNQVGTGKSNNGTWKFVLFVAGNTAMAENAIINLRQICKSCIGDDYDIQVIDLLEYPELARQHRILAVPTVVRTYPPAERRVIGDLSQTQLVVDGLQLPGKLLE